MRPQLILELMMCSCSVVNGQQMRRRHALADRLSRMHHHIRKRNDTGNIFDDLEPLAEVANPFLNNLVPSSTTTSPSLPLVVSSKPSKDSRGQSSSTVDNVRQPLSTSTSNMVFVSSGAPYTSTYDSRASHVSTTLEQPSALPTPLRLPDPKELPGFLDSVFAISVDTSSLAPSTVQVTQPNPLATQQSIMPGNSNGSPGSDGKTRAALITTTTRSISWISATSSAPVAATTPSMTPSLFASEATAIVAVSSPVPTVVIGAQLQSIQSMAASRSTPQQFGVDIGTVPSTPIVALVTSSPTTSDSQRPSTTVLRNGGSSTEQASVLIGQTGADQLSASSDIVLSPATAKPTTIPMLAPASPIVAAVGSSHLPSLAVSPTDRASGAQFSTPMSAIGVSLPSSSAIKPHLVQFPGSATTLTSTPSTTYSAANAASSLGNQSGFPVVAPAAISPAKSSETITSSPENTVLMNSPAASAKTEISSISLDTASISLGSLPAATASSPAVPASISQSIASDGSPDAAATTMSIPPIVITESVPSTASETGSSSTRQPAAGSTDYLPAAIAPASGIIAPSSGQTLVQIGFLESLNYPFVVSNAMTTAQIFAYLPRAIGFALGTDPKTIVSNSLRPFQMSGYSATVAYIMVPTTDLAQLEAHWSDSSSTLYNQQDASLESLVLVIDRSIPLLIGGSTRSTGSTSSTKSTGSTNTGASNSGSLADTGSSNASTTGSAKKIAGIGLGAAVATGAYASAMFFLARRYRRRKLGDRRRSGTLSLAGHASLSPRMPDGSINRAIAISSPTNAQNTLGI